ncbi:RNA polymerase sigma factor [Actinocrispum sp. NPDC049592]|uniref:RNA polymerase sigma factor n=1 Tax=Actinocrispum sp. NPDC049592 TaxID=3154835 RepID=UPI00341AC1F8
MTAIIRDHELRRLFVDHHQHLLHKAWWSTNNRQDAEDLVQEVFVRLVQVWPSRAETVRNERAFVATVLSNVIKDFYRSSNRRPRVAREPVETDAESCSQPEPLLDDELGKVISVLPARQRDVIYLIYGEDLKPAMAAERLGISAKDCHRYHSLGLKRIRAQLTGPLPTEEGRGER